MRPVKLIIVGGFLGAGKTTAILSLANLLAGQHFKVGLVTNDQGSSLVDTEFLRQSGFPVLEVHGGCFCCNFDQFADRLAAMQENEFPDYILAEPVGSCTDLIATLLKPLRWAGRSPVALAPLSIIVDPLRLSRLISDENSPFPNEINYLFKKQLEEADLIVLNKIDRYSADVVRQMSLYLKQIYPGAVILPVSARSGEGLDDWTDLLISCNSDPDKASLDIVYETYARAEEALGWMNCTTRMTAKSAIDGNQVATLLMSKIRDALAARGDEITHLKIFIVSGNDFVKQSIVSLIDPISEDHRMVAYARCVMIVINIRAIADPLVLEQVTRDALASICEQFDMDTTIPVTEAFRPSYPKPMYRLP